MPTLDRPREKMQLTSASALSDFELLQIIIGNGVAKASVGYIAQQILKLMRKGPAALNYEALIAITGIGPALASRILASHELTIRYENHNSAPLRSIKEILARLDDIRDKHQEYLVCMSLDGGQRLKQRRILTIGTLDSVAAHPREIFADAIAERAASVILIHNHPSGDPAPSKRDITLTQQLAAAGQLLGVTLRDHIIVTAKIDSYYSFRQHHML